MSYGRRVIYTNAAEITEENVVEEVESAMKTHLVNCAEIEKLYGYYRGKTQIQSKKKEVRETINHKICENRAFEIVSFHRGYTFGEPIQYIRREKTSNDIPDEEIATEINTLNAYMSDADKAAADNELAEWMYVAGSGYRLVLPNKQWQSKGDEPPFLIYTLDPQNSFVVYSTAVGHRPMMGITYVDVDQERVYSVYTRDGFYTFTGSGVSKVEKESNPLGMIPIIEYPANLPRLGVFETVMSLLDALDELQSNRMDDIVQFVNSFLAILGGQLDEETYNRLNEWKTLCLPEGVDAKYLSPTMNQADVQRLKDDLYQSILTICGVPNRNGGSSTSDTGAASQLRDGWVTAENRAKATELIFKKSEKSFLKLILRILRDTSKTKLTLSDVEPHFTRRNYADIMAKAQVLTTMLSSGKIHPELAFAHCGMFADPESAYLQSKSWCEEQQKKEEERIDNFRANQVPPVQPEADGSKRASTDKVSKVQSAG